MPKLAISRRTRATPFTRRVEAAGCKAYTVYNRTLLPTVFEDPETDCRHLKEHVQVWDVSCQRQVEIIGPDAKALVQSVTPRRLDKMADDQCYYLPVVDDTGGMLNDPVAIKQHDEHWWISLADSDLRLWLKGVAVGRGLNVNVYEPDVSPLAVQGPKADALMERVFGPTVRDIRFFRHKALSFMDTTFTVARSGFSKQGGYEIYVENRAYGEPLWDALFEAGKDLNVRPGCPNLIERIEAGLLSYGNDMTHENTPAEAGLGKFCKIDENTDCIGAEALRQEAQTGPARRMRSLAIGETRLAPCRDPWPVTAVDGTSIGQVTSAAWSIDFGTNVGLGMIDRGHWADGNEVIVHTPEGQIPATLKSKSFL